MSTLKDRLESHTHWLVWEEWVKQDPKTRGKEPPKGERFVEQANLRGAYLWEADLREADLQEADLRRADLRRADLGRAYLWEANLRRDHKSQDE
jgi:hypothetical protein